MREIDENLSNLAMKSRCSLPRAQAPLSDTRYSFISFKYCSSSELSRPDTSSVNFFIAATPFHS